MAALAASLVTVAILFLMTQLTSPVGGDPVVNQMLLELELRQRDERDAGGGIRVFKLPPTPEPERARNDPDALQARPQRPERTEPDEEPPPAERAEIIDWWEKARSVIRSEGDAEFQRWLENQGYQKYVSIMQGPIPSSTGPRRPAEEDAAGSAYQNAYGDVEVRINENCVMQVRPRMFDSTNFAQNIPPLVVCKSAPKNSLAGLEEYVERKANP